ncbi:hypothetical protein VM98_35415, partial [Streptomyces rubellomurinus subsp. indigoferus]
SSRITGTVAEWESWTGLAFPEDGDYVFPGGLSTLRSECARDLGSYLEPGVWMDNPSRTERSGLQHPAPLQQRPGVGGVHRADREPDLLGGMAVDAGGGDVLHHGGQDSQEHPAVGPE